MVKEKAIDLVRKIFAKANNNSNEHEVELAMLKAQELMVKYSLDMKDISLNSDQDKKEVLSAKITDDSKTLWWVKILARVICDNFRCTPIVYQSNGRSHIKFIGLKDDVEMAQNVFYFAMDNIKFYTKRYVNRLKNNTGAGSYTTEKNCYITGFIDGVQMKYQEQVRKNNWGLVLVQDKMVVDYVRKIGTKSKSVRRNYSTNEHYSRGVHDGKNFDYRDDLIKN